MNDTGIEKKKKGKSAMRHWRLFRWIAGFLVISVLVIVILALLGPLLNGQITQSALPQELIPTAEYLLNNPLPTPQNFPVSLTVEQDGSGFTRDAENMETFCIQGFVPDDTHIKVEFNQRPVYGGFETSSGGALRADNGRMFSHCIWGEVETGLHLLSVEMSSDTWNDQNYNYTWAIEITNDGYRHYNESD
jgi:hypothetical protein